MTNTRRAAQAFADFTGRKPVTAKTARLDDRDVTGWGMGPVVGIAYEAKRDGVTKQYFHEFKKTARPNLVSRDDGKQLYIEGGKYKVTDRGIEDMPRLFVVNPSPRRGAKPKRKPMARRRRTATRRRATRQVAVFRANPVRRRKRRAPMRARRRRSFMSNPVRRVSRRRKSSVRRFRRNPSVRGAAVNFGKMLMPAMGIGAGAVGAEILMGYLPIPANFKTGVLRHVTKGLVGVAAGMILGKVFKMKRLGNYFALGAVAIATHDAIKELIASKASSINTSGFGQYVRPLPRQFGGMGYINPAAASRLGQYVQPLASQFGGDNQQVGANPGGETDFRA